MSGASKRKAVDTTATAPKKARSITSFFTPSGVSSTSSTSTSGYPAHPISKFDKKKWVAKLSDEHKSLLRLEIDTMHDSWLGALKEDLTTPDFLSLKRFLQSEKEKGKTIYPPEQDIYSWYFQITPFIVFLPRDLADMIVNNNLRRRTRYTPLDTVKVVILGQDPYRMFYHSLSIMKVNPVPDGPNQAMGLSFSVRPPTPAPPSLKNIYIALKKDYPSFNPPPNNGGLLTPWAGRGVLMLNACLTVRASEPNSHSGKGWERLTQRAIDVVAQRRVGGVVFMAWGTPASKRVLKIDKKKHLVLNSVHPSPLSASRGFVSKAPSSFASKLYRMPY